MTLAFDADSAGCSGALARLAALGFTEEAVRDRLGLEDLNDLQLKALPIYRRERLAERDALALAIELFVLQGTLSEGELGALFVQGDLEALAAAGVLERCGGGVRARVSLYPVGATLVFSDHAWPQLAPGGSAAVPHDQVMYVGADSRWLARTTLRGPVASALDLCCGSGIQALLAAAHARRVTAVDLNPRAVRCTAFNARALGLDHLEALEGDLYGPVAGRTFELITANPPFVPAPDQAVGYRDGGPSGEDVQRRIVEGLPRHLAPGGIAQIVTELGERDGESLEDRLRPWLGGAAMDIHVLRVRIHSTQAYALGHAEGEDAAAYLASVDRWHANLRAQGFDRVVSVLLVFRWNEAPGYRVDEVHPPAREAGQELVSLLEAEALARDPALPERLRAGALVRTAPVALLEAKALGAPAPATVQARLAGRAMPVEHTLAPLELDLLTCLDRPAPVERLLEAGARAGLTADTVLATLVSLVRKGFALPV